MEAINRLRSLNTFSSEHSIFITNWTEHWQGFRSDLHIEEKNFKKELNPGLLDTFRYVCPYCMILTKVPNFRDRLYLRKRQASYFVVWLPCLWCRGGFRLRGKHQAAGEVGTEGESVTEGGRHLKLQWACHTLWYCGIPSVWITSRIDE